ncbi:protein serine/threonine kinase, putative [Entamoeba invadens IP1]|uniref:Protein serine/threonine kinase, putative n=1 Tax=Entamoeba invadens IP1 TaxID=370355 RepID=L7FKU0_ENTIV|nr:protein serine/threonine kinase, putative [Entamoeba invadens IP1]ELP84989.1 protein serine/threonine kinase, putative [Entamoeba invadens IP1]|eukprot:XP_004184335.1 protein serine/threonine kinase, putative [Entamoeba invadens IP1]
MVNSQISDVCQCTPNGNDETNGFSQTNGFSCLDKYLQVFCFNKDFTFSSGSKFYKIITQSSLTFNTSGFNSENICELCKNGYYLNDDFECEPFQNCCVIGDKNTYYKCLNDKVLDKNGNCILNINCIVSNGNSCLKCSSGDMKKECNNCGDDICYFCENEMCLICFKNQFLNELGFCGNDGISHVIGNKVLYCTDGSFISNSTCQKCVQKDINSISCDKTQSTSCKTNYYANSDGECELKYCALNDNKDQNGKCVTKHENCSSYVNQKCVESHENYNMNNEKNCVKMTEILIDNCVKMDIWGCLICEPGYYNNDNNCVKCDKIYTSCVSKAVWWIILIIVIFCLLMIVLVTTTLVFLFNIIQNSKRKNELEKTTTVFSIKKSNICFIPIGNGLGVNTTEINFNNKEKVNVNEKLRELLCVGNTTKHNVKIQISYKSSEKFIFESNPQIIFLGEGEAYEFEIFVTLYYELKVEKKLGEGSFGIVYKGKYRGNVVAIKKLKSLSDYENVVTEFEKEVDMLVKFRSEYIVHFYGAVFIPSKVCIVTDFSQHGSLNDLINHKTSDEAKIIIRLKIMIDAFKGILIIIMLLTNMTFTKGIGTPKYMAPEIFKQDKYKKPADVYSFAITMFECFNWQKAYSNMEFKFSWKIAEFVIFGHRLDNNRNIHHKIYMIIQKCWIQKPNDRIDIENVIKELQDVSI